MRVTPYLNFNGTCAAAFKYYEQVLGGRIEFFQTHAESPMKDHLPQDWQDKVIHVCLNVNGQRLMGSDVPAEHYQPAQGIAVDIHVPTTDEGRRLFDALSSGGKVTMPFAKTFWSPGFGMCVDRFGTPWMINVEAQ